MKILIITALCTITWTSAFGQFFSEEEREEMREEEKEALRQSVPEEEQKAIYREYCASQKTAEDKAIRMYPVKIHQPPEKREENRQKAKHTQESLMIVYKKELAAKHTISEAYLMEVVKTGKDKGWPKQKPKPAEE